MGRADFLRLGDWNAICHLCGRKRKAGDMVQQWQGYWVCKEEWTPRQPQDFVRAAPAPQPPPWVQPPGPDIFVGVCTLADRQAIPDLAGPGCMIPSKDDFLTPPRYGFCTIGGRTMRAGEMSAGCATIGWEFGRAPPYSADSLNLP